MGALFCMAFPPTVVHAVVVSTGRSIGMAPLSLILAVGCYAMGGSEKRGFKNIKVYLRAVHVLGKVYASYCISIVLSLEQVLMSVRAII